MNELIKHTENLIEGIGQLESGLIQADHGELFSNGQAQAMIAQLNDIIMGLNRPLDPCASCICDIDGCAVFPN